MSNRKHKKPISKKGRRVHLLPPNGGADNPRCVSCEDVVDLALDVWRIERRARSEGAHERVLTACQRAGDRLRHIGIEFDLMMDRPYNKNLRMRVVEHEECDEAMRVTECLTPGVLFKGQLLREAEVVTRGK